MIGGKRQEGGDGSENYQADTINKYGISYSEARQIADDVFKANFLELSGQAKMIAEERAIEILEKFLQKALRENPERINSAGDPAFQTSLYSVQKEYAKCGDIELGELLVDLLSDRAEQEKRSILQIVLSESLEIAPKLMEGQWNILTLVFVFKYLRRYDINSLEALGVFFDEFVKPFLRNAPKERASYQHIEYAGCGAVGLGTKPTEKILLDNFPGLFMKGFDISALRAITAPKDDVSSIIMVCFNDSKLVQFNAIDWEVLEKKVNRLQFSGNDISVVKRLYDSNLMSAQETKDLCVKVREYMASYFALEKTTEFGKLTLTSVGIAIAHANLNKNTTVDAPLDIWIN